MDISAIVLCGGQSSRMDYKNKCFFKLGDLSFIEIITKKLSTIFDNILLVAKNPKEYIPLGYKVITDIFRESSSLTGIHAGLIYSTTRYNFVIGCDTPLIKLKLIKYLVSTLDTNFQVIVPKVEGYFEPLCAIYSKDCIPIIEDMLKKNSFKISKLFSKVNTMVVEDSLLKKYDPSLYSFFNINTKEDYKKALKIYFNVI